VEALDNLDVFSFREDRLSGFVPAARVSSLRRAGLVVTFVAGFEYHLEDGSTSNFDPGAPVVVEAEPNNPRDPFALAVRSFDSSLQAGYVPSFVCRTLPALRGRRHGRVLYEVRDEGRRAALGIAFGAAEMTLKELGPAGKDQMRTLVAHLPLPYAVHSSTTDPIEQLKEMARWTNRRRWKGS
jgi:hypothetical protein